jgi:hypothetical protein
MLFTVLQLQPGVLRLYMVRADPIQEVQMQVVMAAEVAEPLPPLDLLLMAAQALKVL